MAPVTLARAGALGCALSLLSFVLVVLGAPSSERLAVQVYGWPSSACAPREPGLEGSTEATEDQGSACGEPAFWLQIGRVHAQRPHEYVGGHLHCPACGAQPARDGQVDGRGGLLVPAASMQTACLCALDGAPLPWPAVRPLPAARRPPRPATPCRASAGPTLEPPRLFLESPRLALETRTLAWLSWPALQLETMRAEAEDSATIELAARCEGGQALWITPRGHLERVHVQRVRVGATDPTEHALIELPIAFGAPPLRIARDAHGAPTSVQWLDPGGHPPGRGVLARFAADGLVRAWPASTAPTTLPAAPTPQKLLMLPDPVAGGAATALDLPAHAESLCARAQRLAAPQLDPPPLERIDDGFALARAELNAARRRTQRLAGLSLAAGLASLGACALAARGVLRGAHAALALAAAAGLFAWLATLLGR